MRTLFIAASVLTIASAGFAQAPPAPQCWSAYSTTRGRVVSLDGQTREGLLACLDPAHLIIVPQRPNDAAVVLPMTSIRRIQTRGDSLLNGFLRGATVGFLGGLLSGGEGCRSYGSCVAGATISWGLIGTGIDYLHGRPKVLYERARGH